MQKKNGISLIVLVITIIVMIILAGVIMISLNNSGIIKKAEQAVEDTNLQEIRNLAALKWSEAYLKGEGKYTQRQLKDEVMLGLEQQKFDLTPYEIIVTTKGVTVNKIPTIADLEATHTFEYYRTLKDAVNAVNGDETVVNVKKADAVAGIYIEEGIPTVVLLKDTTENARLNLNKDVIINLGGHILTSNSNVGISGMKDANISITIDGRLHGSTIINKISQSGATIQARENNKMQINGGKYITNYIGELVTETKAFTINCTSNSEIEVINCEIETNIQSEYKEGMKVYLYAISNLGKAKVDNCNIKATSAIKADMSNAVGIANFDNAEILNSKIYTDATNELSNESNSIGVYNAGYVVIKDSYIFSDAPTGDPTKPESNGIENYMDATATIINCDIFGTSSAIQTDNRSKTYVTGGTLEGAGYGGFWFEHGETGEVYVEGAKIIKCEYKGKYENFTTAGNTALRIGNDVTAGKKIIVNFNNCEIININGPAIAFAGTDNTVRISNSKISTDYKISINSDTHELLIGRGCNFKEDDTDLVSVVTKTNDVYTRPNN